MHLEYSIMITKVIGSEIIPFGELGSTNQYLADLCREKDLSNGSVVTAEFQLAGRGQDTNTWYSSAGRNILMSIYLQTAFIRTENQFILNKFISLGILDYLKEIVDPEIHPLRVKWPNDIYIGSRKAGGILIQNQVQGEFMEHSIIGIGLNINEESFPEEIPNPVSLYQITGKRSDIVENLKNLLTTLDHRYRQLVLGYHESLHTEYIESLFRYESRHKYRIKEGIIHGTIKGIDEYGKLILETEGIYRDFDLKEIEFIIDQE